MGVQSWCHFYASRLSTETTDTSLTGYLNDKNFNDVMVVKMNSKFPNIYSSFKVSVPAKDKEKLFRSEIWPNNAVVSPFFQFLLRKKNQT